MQVFSSPKSVSKGSFSVPDPAEHLFLAKAFESFTNTNVFCASNPSQLLFSECFCPFTVWKHLWWQCKAAIYSLSTHAIKAVHEAIAWDHLRQISKNKIHPILSLARNNIRFITSSQWHVPSLRSVRFERHVLEHMSCISLPDVNIRGGMGLNFSVWTQPAFGRAVTEHDPKLTAVNS